jgi:phage terminase small subunit
METMSTAVIPVKLPSKQELFCQYFSESRNATQSYRKAYQNLSSNTNSLSTMGAKLLRNANIRKRIDQLTQSIALDAHIKPMIVLNEYADLAFTNIVDMLDGKGNVKNLKELSKGQRKAIKKIKTTTVKKYNARGKTVGETVTTEIELHDKVKALDSLANFTGVLQPDVVNQIFVDARNETNNIVQINPDDLPTDVLEKMIADKDIQV